MWLYCANTFEGSHKWQIQISGFSSLSSGYSGLVLPFLFLTERHPSAQRTFIHHRVYFSEETSYFLTNHNTQAATISASACSWPGEHYIQNKTTSAFGPTRLGVVPLGPKSAVTDKDGPLYLYFFVELTPQKFLSALVLRLHALTLAICLSGYNPIPDFDIFLPLTLLMESIMNSLEPALSLLISHSQRHVGAQYLYTPCIIPPHALLCSSTPRLWSDMYME